MITAIVSADNNWGIGRNGSQLTHIPEDDKYIFGTTSGNTVIMGRKTYEKLSPNSMPKERTNIVLSRNPYANIKGATVCTSPGVALEKAAGTGTDIYVLGGGETFRSMLDHCDEVQVTSIDYEYDADTWFPDLDKKPEWVLVDTSEEHTHFDTVYYIKKYVRRKDFKN